MSFHFQIFGIFSFCRFHVFCILRNKRLFSCCRSSILGFSKRIFRFRFRTLRLSLSFPLSHTPTQRTVLLLLLCAHALQLSCALSSLLSLSLSLSFCNWNTVTTARQNAFWWHEIYEKNSCMPAIVLQQQQQQQQRRQRKQQQQEPAQAELAEWQSSQL